MYLIAREFHLGELLASVVSRIYIFYHKFFDPELIPYCYSSCCCCCSCWRRPLQKSPNAPSFLTGSVWNLAGLFFK